MERGGRGGWCSRVGNKAHAVVDPSGLRGWAAVVWRFTPNEEPARSQLGAGCEWLSWTDWGSSAGLGQLPSGSSLARPTLHGKPNSILRALHLAHHSHSSPSLPPTSHMCALQVCSRESNTGLCLAASLLCTHPPTPPCSRLRCLLLVRAAARSEETWSVGDPAG